MLYSAEQCLDEALTNRLTSELLGIGVGFMIFIVLRGFQQVRIRNVTNSTPLTQDTCE